MSRKSIEELIIKFVENTATLEEQVKLRQLLEIKENRNYFEEYVELNYLMNSKVKFDYKNSLEEVMDKIQSKPKSLNVYRYLKYAAAIILLISTGYFLTKNKNQFKTTPKIVIDNKIPIGTDKATLTLEDGSTIALEKGRNYTNNVVNSNGEQLVYTSTSEKNSIKKPELKYNYLTIPRGGEFFMELSDGTKIWLNSETKIKYPIAFIEGEPRKVELLYGEAYFEVSPSTKHNGDSFIVNLLEQEIEVLGTAFNVKAYLDDEDIKTTLVEGKIALKTDAVNEILKPSQQSIYNKRSKKVAFKEINAFYETSWRHGEFNFNNKSLEEVMTVLSRWYDVKIEIQNKENQKFKYIGTLGKHQNIEIILLTLKLTNNLKYEITKDKIIIK